MPLIGRRLILEGSHRYGDIDMGVIKEREKEVRKRIWVKERISVFGFEGAALSETEFRIADGIAGQRYFPQ